MLGMLDTDSSIHDPIALFLSMLDTKLPNKSKKVHERVDEEVVSDAKRWLTEFRPIALKEKRSNDVDRATERHEGVLEETHLRATEMCHYIFAGTARHPELKAKLKPRMGKSPDDNIENLVDMRKRLTEHANELKEHGIVIKLDALHAEGAVTEQAAAHLKAQSALDLLDKTEDSQQGRLVALRKEGKLLQTRINKQIVAAIPGNRAMQVLFGYTEREAARSSADEKTEKTEKKTEKKTAAPAPATPPAPGPVASGTSAPVAAGETTTTAPAPDQSTPPPDAKLDPSVRP